MSTQPAILIDSNLLLILLVGRADRSQVGRAKRTHGYTPESYDLLTLLVDQYAALIITPNILTEVSNLAGKLLDGSLKDDVFRLLASLPVQYLERYIPSSAATSEQIYSRFCLTDAVIMLAGRLAATVLTTDGPLYEALWKADIPAINFTHVRQEYGDL